MSGCGQEGKDEQGDTYTPIPHKHEVAGETCFICDASKRDKGRLWCKEHARYEDRCWLCQPQLEDKKRMYCKEHSLYEDECHLCHPEVEGDDGTTSLSPPAKNSKSGHSLYCNEHDLPEAECGICQPDLAASLLPGDDMKVRLVSKASADKAGIRTELPRMKQSAPEIGAYCESQYNLNTMAKVPPLVGGIIRHVYKDVGDKVEKGEPLAELHSADVATAKSVYLTALVDLGIEQQNYDRENRLQKQNLTSEKEVLEAKAAFRKVQLSANNYRQRLLNLGMADVDIDKMEKASEPTALLTIRAPFRGTLIKRNAVVGEAVEPGHSIFTLADLSTRWLEISIHANNLAQIEKGQTVEAVFPELPDAHVSGQITWVDTAIDPNTRMIKARALATENTDQLAVGLFGKIYIITGEANLTARVPKESIQRHDGSDFVFVQDAPDLFSLRRVSIGNKEDSQVQVLAGLSPQDSIVTDGSFIVMSEFLKSRLGAGCVDD